LSPPLSKGRPGAALLFSFLSWCIVAAAHADPQAGARKAEACAGCHGADGNPALAPYPVLAGQSARYLYLQLRDFKEGRRRDPDMDVMAAALSRDDMLDLADWFSGRKAKPVAFTPDAARVDRGRKKSEETLCTMCHLGGFRGQNEIPRVAGQRPEYVVKQLRAFKARTRTNDAGNMTAVARTLGDEDIVDLAHYIATLD